VKEPCHELKAFALTLGITRVGVARAEALDVEAAHLEEWLVAGCQAEMGWMAKAPERRTDPRVVLPGAASVVVIAVNYYTPVEHRQSEEYGKISRYAWGDDYHDVVGGMVTQLEGWMRSRYPGAETRGYVDTGPVMEKAWAQRAGVGWLGKHGNIITRDHGSWVFLGVILTTVDFATDARATDHCGTCTRCIEACPTAAIVKPGVVDAGRCLSYLTIEHRGEVSDELAPLYEGWIYGCDICQDVCPWNQKFSVTSPDNRFAPREESDAPLLEEWQTMTQQEFSKKFKGSPVKRTKLSGLLRNIRVVRGGS
jgi:epoxyqueuosine reductase